MSFFDRLKQQAANAKGNSSNSSSGGGNATYSVVLHDLPVNLAQLQSMPEASLKEPQNTAALTIAALCIYPIDKNASLEMLSFLQGPRELTPYDKQFIQDRFRDKDYVPRSYFEGATPNNNYEPSVPYTITLFENPYSRSQEGYLTLHVNSGGADSPRQIKLRLKPSTGQWFLWEQFLLSDIRKPVSADPWA
ncbi:MAG: hypothetical protein E7334_02600 [Clostridiales bacterium]|nr:hypothetical protein [Clostridiales bacterium]